MQRSFEAESKVWGEYPNWDDVARFDYGRLLWRRADMRARLIAHWMDERHPYRERFQENRAQVEAGLSSEASSSAIDAAFRAQGTSLRCVAREIPPVFGSFF